MVVSLHKSLKKVLNLFYTDRVYFDCEIILLIYNYARTRSLNRTVSRQYAAVDNNDFNDDGDAKEVEAENYGFNDEDDGKTSESNTDRIGTANKCI